MTDTVVPPFECPIPATHDKYNEAHYFIGRMLHEYHSVDPFRWNLNAFLQALRSVTFMLQAEMGKADGFEVWYAHEQEKMRADHLMKTFADSRTLVVHQGMLTSRSKASVGLFRGRRLKLAFATNAAPGVDSEHLLRVGQEQFIGFILDEEHSSIDEQIGVQRTWIVEELGLDEVVGLCDQAWARIGLLLNDAHKLVGAKLEETPPVDAHAASLADRASVLLESDLDPSLPKTWGW